MIYQHHSVKSKERQNQQEQLEMHGFIVAGILSAS